MGNACWILEYEFRNMCNIYNWGIYEEEDWDGAKEKWQKQCEARPYRSSLSLSNPAPSILSSDVNYSELPYILMCLSHCCTISLVYSFLAFFIPLLLALAGPGISIWYVSVVFVSPTTLNKRPSVQYIIQIIFLWACNFTRNLTKT